MAGIEKDFQLVASCPLKQHASHIRMIKTVWNENIFYSLEDKSKEVAMYENGLKISYTFPTKKKNPHDRKANIIALDYDPDLDILGFIATDRQFYLYETKSRQRLLHTEEGLPLLGTGLYYLGHKKLWISTCNEFSMTAWRVTRKGICTVEVVVFQDRN